MNSELYIKACELAKAIANSQEATKLKETERIIRNDKVANNLTERWLKIYNKVQELEKAGKPLSENDERSIEFIEAKVENHPLILDYIDAYQKFTALLQEVNDVLMGALESNINADFFSYNDCPSQGKCDNK